MRASWRGAATASSLGAGPAPSGTGGRGWSMLRSSSWARSCAAPLGSEQSGIPDNRQQSRDGESGGTRMSKVPAAENTLRILEYLGGQRGPAPAAAIASALGLPRSTVYHLL